jgi:hypothetical protein
MVVSERRPAGSLPPDDFARRIALQVEQSDARNHAEQERQERLLTKLHQELVASNPDLSLRQTLGTEAMPKAWVDGRLMEMGESWRRGEYWPPP